VGAFRGDHQMLFGLEPFDGWKNKMIETRIASKRMTEHE
jgi:hypothetical protein